LILGNGHWNLNEECLAHTLPIYIRYKKNENLKLCLRSKKVTYQAVAALFIGCLPWWAVFAGGLSSLVGCLRWWAVFPGGLSSLVGCLRWWVPSILGNDH
jgi:hypothetical protein